ncbi:MAG: twin-arginine translocase subunit TatC [Candidatus Zixiibacteriota bacterium]|nr:MAG: twin-arginine translocase subunit TatC [candidate division Zixibacteria bacterium]
MPEETESKNIKEMPFLDHLEEFRWRLIKCLIAIAVCAFAAFFFSNHLFSALWLPLNKAAPELKIHYFKVTEGFTTRLKLSLLAGVLFASPIVFYQIWKFILPGLYEREVKIIIPIVFFSTFFFLLGIVFCYFVLLPFGLNFFYSQAPVGTVPTLMMGDYLNFILVLLLAFGIVFQLPVVSYFLGKIGLISSDFLASGRRYALVIVAVVAAVITPPDFISQLGIGIPLYILYEISIIIVRLTGASEKRKKASKNLAG